MKVGIVIVVSNVLVRMDLVFDIDVFFVGVILLILVLILIL